MHKLAGRSALNEIAKYRMGMSRLSANQVMDIAGDELHQKDEQIKRLAEIKQEQLNKLFSAHARLSGWLANPNGQATEVYRVISETNEEVSQLLEQFSLQKLEEVA